MRVNKIELHNFRNFEDIFFEFPSQFSVVIGENGKGKSSLLQAVRLAAGTFLLGLDEPQRLHIQKEDVRRIDAGHRFAPQRDCYFHAWGEINGQAIDWKRTLAREGGRTDSKNAAALIEIASTLNKRVNENLENDVDLPVFCFFSTARLWSEAKQRIDLKKKGSKIKDGYAKCLDIKSDRITPLEWIKANYYKGLKGKEREGLLEAVLEAITTCVPAWSELEWDEDSDDLAGIYKENGSSSFVPLYYLSDGLRTMAGMIAEIAYRCVILNDHLGRNAVKKSEGIVMIDEIDMHLHPNWQRQVITDMKKAFPNIQFIVTTHSPFIVQSVKQEELINLDPATAADPITLGLEEVAKDIMGVSDTRSEYYQEYFSLAADYFKMLETAEHLTSPNEKEDLRKKLDEVESKFQQDPAYAAFLKLNRAAKLGKE